MKQHFTHTVMTVYPLLYVEMPQYLPGMEEVHAKRNQFIKSLEDKGVVGFLTSHAAQFQSFDIDELDYNYCNMHLKV